jgi:DNA helicase-2/ATP-dependent DNA helicase PcrA
MTLHSAKGLEFPVVYMTGMEERLFPHVRSLEDPEQMEEERRLCYVGMTRAREYLVLTNARRRRTFGQEQFNPPSRFIDDIPKELLDIRDESLHSYSAGGSFGSRRPYPPASGYASAELRHNLEEVLDRDHEEPANEVRVVPDEEVDVYSGMKVRHGRFGVGTVRSIEGAGDNRKIVVRFNAYGEKKLMLRFAGLERV